MADDEPPWLDEAQLQAWFALMSVAMVLPSKLETALRRDAELGLYEYLVLAVLSESPQRRIGLKALSGLTNGSMSRLSHVVSRLENRGLVERHPDPDDGRLTRAHLTDLGFERIVAAAPGHVATARELVVDVLTPTQLEQLHVICDQLADRLLDGERLPRPRPSEDG